MAFIDENERTLFDVVRLLMSEGEQDETSHTPNNHPAVAHSRQHPEYREKTVFLFSTS